MDIVVALLVLITLLVVASNLVPDIAAVQNPEARAVFDLMTRIKS